MKVLLAVLLLSSLIYPQRDSVRYHRHYELLPVAALSFFLAWDYALQTRDLARSLKAIGEDLHPTKEYNDLSALHSRKQKFTIAFALVGSMTTYFAFKKSRISAIIHEEDR